MQKVKPTAWKLFTYLARLADFDTSHTPNYGKCRRTNEQIAKATGIGKNQLPEYYKQLERLGLIEWDWEHRRTKDRSGYETIHTFTVKYFLDEDIRESLSRGRR